MRPSDTDEIAAMILHWAFIVVSAGVIGSLLYGMVWLALL